MANWSHNNGDMRRQIANGFGQNFERVFLCNQQLMSVSSIDPEWPDDRFLENIQCPCHFFSDNSV